MRWIKAFMRRVQVEEIAWHLPGPKRSMLGHQSSRSDWLHPLGRTLIKRQRRGHALRNHRHSGGGSLHRDHVQEVCRHVLNSGPLPTTNLRQKEGEAVMERPLTSIAVARLNAYEPVQASPRFCAVLLTACDSCVDVVTSTSLGK